MLLRTLLLALALVTPVTALADPLVVNRQHGPDHRGGRRGRCGMGLARVPAHRGQPHRCACRQVGLVDVDATEPDTESG